ncbi:hypothetical protein [Paraglaciecola aestuariivivens]
MPSVEPSQTPIKGEFIEMDNDRYYVIRQVEKLPPFFISVVSDSDHWLFVASNGGITAGRVSPEHALFPYLSVDRIYDSATQTGSKTLIQVTSANQTQAWQPFNQDFNQHYNISQNLYKNTLGNKLCFEEINHDLGLSFRYSWHTSDKFGFVRECQLVNLTKQALNIRLVDGLQNILPAGTPRITQTTASNLVDAYKWNELEPSSGLGIYSLYSGITDRAQPSESLYATTVFALGFEQPNVLLSTTQLKDFYHSHSLTTEHYTRGVRGAYLVETKFSLASQNTKSWKIVANVEQSQEQVTELIQTICNQDILTQINTDLARGSDQLARIMAAADGFQVTNEELVSVHHYANTLFNTLRGGIFADQYKIALDDFRHTLKSFNLALYQQHQQRLDALPQHLEVNQFIQHIQLLKDPQLLRLATEYLPVTFGRRHGDPSRPWNQFEIKVRDKNGKQNLSYQGNWRDIFQNWEALCFSYPEFIESVIAKFVNASTLDGYNPYRITKSGIDWEVEELDDPWSFIGYWGDHQIIYLLKMLEMSASFHPQTLSRWLSQALFAYANVPYRIKPLEQILENPKDTVIFDEEAAKTIAQRVSEIGFDGKLLTDAQGKVYQVNLLEKLLVPLLAKLANLVLDAGIWLNTQRPEWNDANNALVGQGVSVVTLNYLRRYIAFMQTLLAEQNLTYSLSQEVATWLTDTASILARVAATLNDQPVSAACRYQTLLELGQVATKYRSKLYQKGHFSGKAQMAGTALDNFLSDALSVVEHSIKQNQQQDKLFHAYNLLHFSSTTADIDHLYPMLEGQVAALSAHMLSPKQAIQVVQALYQSAIFSAEHDTFMLYPDRSQQSFLSKNQIAVQALQAIPIFALMIDKNDKRIVLKDAQQHLRFSPELKNSSDLQAQLAQLKGDYPQLTSQVNQQILALYEETFNHQAFTGRSGGMFGFEGLGCVYWHMVSKLLLAVQEYFFISLAQASDNQDTQVLGELYYKIRAGLGFNKSPQEYGAFPCDPYSHTPKHSGAQQPGMTGQVKEEILCRFGELGIVVENGQVSFKPRLLRVQEFLAQPKTLTYLDVHKQWQTLTIPAKALAFTWCQLPIVYRLADTSGLTIEYQNGHQDKQQKLALSAEQSQEIFTRTGQIRSIEICLSQQDLFNEV